MVYVGSEVVQFIEGQMLGRVFFELGVRGGGGNFIVIFWWRFAHPILTHLKIGSALWLGSEMKFTSVF